MSLPDDGFIPGSVHTKGRGKTSSETEATNSRSGAYEGKQKTKGSKMKGSDCCCVGSPL